MKKHNEIIFEFKQALKSSGISQIKAAEIIGLHPHSLNRILVGAAHTSDETLDAIAELIKKLKKSGLIAS